MAIAILPPPPRRTANPAPMRPANSVRRTSSIDVSWPEGELGDRLFIGRVRDYRTPPAGGVGTPIAEAEVQARLALDKTITAIAAAPSPSRIGALVGLRGGNHLRLAIRELMPELIAEGAPLYLALDDLSGTALVSAFGWSLWNPEWAERMRAQMADGSATQRIGPQANVCWGLQDGNSGVDPETRPDSVADADAGDLRNPADPQGWHALPEADGAGFRRARRIDVTHDACAGLLRIEAAFQDSARQREGGRIAIHEYRIAATADAKTLELRTLEPEARVLPFSECPGAIANARRLIGGRLPEIRESVLAHLRGPEGCTHLNDALRALAEVPKLAQYLETRAA
ncbi:MAG TPA: DUF2889 domain-containing protein [Novosphingobium sp.]